MPFNFFSLRDSAPANALMNWLVSPPNAPPKPVTGLFQTRITHTPGGFGDIGGLGGTYAHQVDPRIAAASQDYLNPQDRAALARYMAPLGTGFITLPSSSIQGDIQAPVIRHEQIHALMDKSGALQHAGEIAPLVDPSVQSDLRNDPQYQAEARQYGWPNVIADEGTAYSLGQAPGRMGAEQYDPALQAKVMQFIKDRVQQKQFQKLTQRPGQSQK